MKPIKQLSHLQMDVMRILWDRGEASVGEVHAGLQSTRGLATTTVATVLSRLEKDGVVEHRTVGRQFIYRARISEWEVRRSMVRDLIDRVFRGDSTALVGHLLRESDIRPGDLEQVQAILAEAGGGEDGD